MSCAHDQPAPSALPTAGMTDGRTIDFTETKDPIGLRFTLREATPPGEAADRLMVTPSTLLSDADVSRLLARAEPLVEHADDKQAFALRKASEPPPLTGATIANPFPPPGLAPTATKPPPAGPLHVTRHAPDGDLAVVPHVVVSFDQPMVALTTQEQAGDVLPVQMEPQPPGHWRWLGTQQLQFDPDGRTGEPEGRLPASTEYKVTIPAGTTSATGGKLEVAESFSFRTPTVNVTQAWPSSNAPTDLDPVIVLSFDQEVQATEVLDHVRLEGGGRVFAVRLATDAEIQRDAVAQSLVASAQKNRTVALHAKDLLPKDTSFTVTLSKGLRSIEGPRTTPSDWSYGFFTYAPLEIVKHQCGWNDVCSPSMAWTIWANNALDPDAFDPSAITITPGFKASVGASGEVISIVGEKDGRTTYKVVVPSSLKDIFGQTLGKDQTVQFDVGPAEKTLYGPGPEMVVLDPGQSPHFPVWSINHKAIKVDVRRVEAADWPSWVSFLRKWRYDDAKPGVRPGTSVRSETLSVDPRPDHLVETDLDLSPYLTHGHGQFVVWIEPTEQPKNRWERQYAYAWVQVTDIGVTAFVDPQRATVWTASLSTGAALSDVSLSLSTGGVGTTGADGLGALDLPVSIKMDADGYQDQEVVVARKGDDVAILPESTNWYGGGSWIKQSQLDQLRWYVFDDRGLYRPKEEVRVKGWLRRLDPKVHGDLGELGDARPTSIHWTLTSSMGNPMGEGDTKVSALGGFDVAFKIPDTANLGTAQLSFVAASGGVADTTWTHPIEIQEFRRPEFEVTAKSPEGRWSLGQEATFSVAANYYAGGGLPAAEVDWDIWATPTTYSPPGHDGFSFGRFVCWWDDAFGEGMAEPGRNDQRLQGKTDATGQHYVAAHFEAMNPPRPMTVTAQASVMDVNRQQWTSASTLLVHPSEVYLGLKTDRQFVQKGDRVLVDVIAVDPDGAGTRAEASLQAVRLDWGFAKGQWRQLEKDAQDCSVTATSDPERCTFNATAGGEWRIRASAKDGQGRTNESELYVWVAGADSAPSRGLAQEKVTLIPERQTYAPGETAKILVQAPFAPAEGTLTVERSGVVRQERFHMDGASLSLEVPILDEHIPNVHVQVDLVGLQDRTDDHGNPMPGEAKRTAYATGGLEFQVPALSRKLAVDVHPGSARLNPGDKTTVEVDVKDRDGKAVPSAELAVVVADESVLALTGYKLPDPLAVFYASRGGDVTTIDLRQHVLLDNPTRVADAGDEAGREGFLGRANGAGGGGAMRSISAMPMSAAAPAMEVDELKPSPPPDAQAFDAPTRSRMMDKLSAAVAVTGASAPIAVRSNFEALALFAPDVITDAKGHASVALTLPDSLTRYRVMVVAVSGGKLFGSGESNVTARLPLMVRPSAPRFLNFGDAFELPVVLQNQTDASMTVDVAVRATNVVFMDKTSDPLPDALSAPVDSVGRRVTVPANDRVEIRFPAGTVMAGTARFQVVATAGSASDAARVELPVWTPATTEAFATYGTTEGPTIVQPVAAPADVWPQFGGLQVQTSSTQLQALTDAVLYLEHYPYDCNEQIASRVMGIAALRDVLTAFESPDLPPAKELEAQVDLDLGRLHDRQNYDGGFAFWRRGDESWPYLGIYVAHAYAEAKLKDYTIPSDAWSRSWGYLRNIEQHIPSWYSEYEKRYLRAYALYVRWRMGDTDLSEARRILKEGGDPGLSLEGHGYLLPVLFAGGDKVAVAQQLQYLANHGTENAGALSFGDTYESGAYVLLASDRRADGVILRALLAVDPQSDMVPKIVKGLLAHRKKGHWANTQEDTFILLALDTYFSVYEKETPDFVAKVWLGDAYVGDHAFKGRTTERVLTDVPMDYLLHMTGSQDLVIAKEGAGRVYYRLGMSYAPKDLDLEPMDSGFYVKRSYESVDDPSDVRQDTDGTWHVAAGKKVRVRLTMVAQSRRYHVALVDPLPAGLEAMNPTLATTGQLPSDPSTVSNQPWWFWWTRTWYEHENLRDDRVEAFTSLLWDGAWEYTYIARATTPGRYVVPPAKAEEMYEPETFGRSGTDRLIVE